ncbi:MAG: DUF3253 domain-containing protein [Planctomycetota bacterium]
MTPRPERPTDSQAVERALIARLERSAPGASICPSEVARIVGGVAWRAFMEPVREAGRRLAMLGQVEFLQRGAVIEPASARGPIRLRRAPGLPR